MAPDGADDPPTQEVCDRARAAAPGCSRSAPGVLERVADTVTPQPVLAVLPMLDEPAPGADVPVGPPVRPLVVVLVDVRDPGNAGTVLRTADASGVDAVVFAADSVDPYNPKTVRASAGSLFHVPFAVRDDPARVAAELAGRGLPHPGHRRPGRATDYAGARLVGARRRCSSATSPPASTPDAVRRARRAVAIPMAGRAESLNVGVACAVVCFEAFRQRRARDGRRRPT